MVWLLIPLWFVCGAGAWWWLRIRKPPVAVRGITASSQFEDDLLDTLFIDGGPLTFADTMYLSLDTEPPEKEDEH